MKNRLYTLGTFVLVLMLIISLTLVIAAPNGTGNENQTKSNGTGNGTKAPGPKLNKNMTYGQCVNEFAKVKNACFEAGKKNLEACKKNAEKSKNLSLSENCKINNGKKNEQCKDSYKTSKETTCKKYKKAFLDYLAFWN